MGMGPCARGPRERDGSLARCSLTERGSSCPDVLPHPQQTEPGGFGVNGPCQSPARALPEGDTGPASPWVTFCLGLGSPWCRAFLAPGQPACKGTAAAALGPTLCPCPAHGGDVQPPHQCHQGGTPAGALMRSGLGGPASLTYPPPPGCTAAGAVLLFGKDPTNPYIYSAA